MKLAGMVARMQCSYAWLLDIHVSTCATIRCNMTFIYSVFWFRSYSLGSYFYWSFGFLSIWLYGKKYSVIWFIFIQSSGFGVIALAHIFIGHSFSIYLVFIYSVLRSLFYSPGSYFYTKLMNIIILRYSSSFLLPFSLYSGTYRNFKKPVW